MSTSLKRISRLLLLSLCVFIFSCEQQNSQSVKIECITLDATDITMNSATLNGIAIIENGEGLNGKAYFYYSPFYTDIDDLKASGTRINAGAVSPEGGSYEVVLSGLTAGTSYYFAASVSVGGQEAFGSVGAFVTVSKSAEQIITAEADMITTSTAHLYGYVDLAQLESSGLEFGIIVSMEETPTENNGTVWRCSEVDGKNKFFAEVCNLRSGSTYYYKAYVKSGSVSRTGEIKSFMTIPVSAIINSDDVIDKGVSYATLRGTLKVTNEEALPKEVWFLYGKNLQSLEDLKSSGDKQIVALGDDGSFIFNLTSLPSSSTYYYVACAKVYDNEFYGEVKSFTTESVKATVITSSATSVGIAKGVLHGALTIENTEDFSNDISIWFLSSTSLNSLNSLKTGGDKITSVTAWMNTPGNYGFQVILSKLPPSSTCYYVACAKVYDQEFYGDVISFTTNSLPEGAVDLGLSVAWATCNIGATSPEEYGGYYAWGETETKNNYSWETYKWCNGSSDNLTKYNTSGVYGIVDNRLHLELEDDVAHVKLGDNWRMPTIGDWSELLLYCTGTWTRVNGVYGRRFTSNINGNSIFLPTAGWHSESTVYRAESGCYYWSSTLDSNIPYNAKFLFIDSVYGYEYRFRGYSVRPVVEY